MHHHRHTGTHEAFKGTLAPAQLLNLAPWSRLGCNAFPAAEQ